MKISELFDVQYGINLELVNCQLTNADDPEGVNFVARTANNNGVVARVKAMGNLLIPPVCLHALEEEVFAQHSSKRNRFTVGEICIFSRQRKI